MTAILNTKIPAVEAWKAPALGRQLDSLDFELPKVLEARQPPEARGLRRDQVRLLVSQGDGEPIEHWEFTQLPSSLDPGDVLVLNTSATLNAALSGTLPGGMAVEVHLSTRLPGDLWVVEVRQVDGRTTRPFGWAAAGEHVALEGGGTVVLHTPFVPGQRMSADEPVRLWVATFELAQGLEQVLAQRGFPIRYGYVEEEWPLEYYQTVYATEPGSAEMPSAGRAFTPELMTRLVAAGVQIAPLLLHTGVSSLEEHEPPYEEYYRVSAETAAVVNRAVAAGKRVVAVGTTSVRALETVTAPDGTVHPGEGWTDLVISPQRPLRAVDALLTGFHEPRASHLALLETLAGHSHLKRAYAAALDEGYLWHEFGDLHLILT